MLLHNVGHLGEGAISAVVVSAAPVAAKLLGGLAVRAKTPRHSDTQYLLLRHLLLLQLPADLLRLLPADQLRLL